MGNPVYVSTLVHYRMGNSDPVEDETDWEEIPADDLDKVVQGIKDALVGHGTVHLEHVADGMDGASRTDVFIPVRQIDAVRLAVRYDKPPVSTEEDQDASPAVGLGTIFGKWGHSVHGPLLIRMRFRAVSRLWSGDISRGYSRVLGR